MSFSARPTFVLLATLAAIILLSAASVAKADDDHAGPKSGAKSGLSEDVESEHIFGFTEGTDIGEKGEREIESTFISSLGKIGPYANLFNETAMRYVPIDNLRLSIGTLTDFYAIHDVPGLMNRTSFGVSGLDAEARLVVLDRHSGPFGIDLGINPQWRHLDDVSGVGTQSYALPLTLIFEKDFLAQNIFTAINLTYTPALARTLGLWQHTDSFETSAAISAIVAPNILAGAEIRHLAFAENGTFKEEALFAGPSLYAKLADHFEAKVAWSAQVSGLSSRGLDLENFTRHQIILLLAYTF
jgi:hypothetical protein